MKKILNHVDNVVEEMLQGVAQAHSDLVHRVGHSRVIARNYEGKGKVGIISGGGSGHEPSHGGFVGQGMLAAAVAGDVFTSPTPDMVLEGIKAANKGAGVFLVIKNYTGDVLNFEMAKDMASMEGIDVEYCVTDDDIAVEDSLYTAGRRGVGGTVLVHKILGAHAERGASLQQLKALSDKLLPQIKTLGLALSAATVPAAGKPGFMLAEDEIEFGIGIHNEPGYRKEKLRSSAVMAKEFYDRLKQAFPLKSGGKIAILVNGMGATPLMELYVFANDVFKLLKADGIQVEYAKVGNYMTSIDMAGLSLTFLHLSDAQWLKDLKEPVHTIAW
jgi:dihydroxyacetone kinase-like protein